MFLNVVNVLLTSDFKCSYFADKDICQFLVMIWCVHGLWFIEDLGLRMECEAFNNYQQCSADDWVEWIVVDKLSHKDPLGSVSLKSIPPLLKIKLQELINVFCLIIYFQMKGSWELDINVHVKIYLFSEIADKLKIMIWYNGVKSTVFLIKFNKSDMIYTNSINLLYRYEHDVF